MSTAVSGYFPSRIFVREVDGQRLYTDGHLVCPYRFSPWKGHRPLDVGTWELARTNTHRYVKTDDPLPDFASIMPGGSRMNGEYADALDMCVCVLPRLDTHYVRISPVASAGGAFSNRLVNRQMLHIVRAISGRKVARYRVNSMSGPVEMYDHDREWVGSLMPLHPRTIGEEQIDEAVW